MSNNYEKDLAVQIEGLTKDLGYLTSAVEKVTKMFSEHTEKDSELRSKINTLEHNQTRQEATITELKKILLDQNDQKQTGLLTEFRELKTNFANYLQLVKEEKEESKERAIKREEQRKIDEEKRELEKQKLEEKKELKRQELEEKKEKEFNRKLGIITVAVAVLAIVLPMIKDYLQGK